MTSIIDTALQEIFKDFKNESYTNYDSDDNVCAILETISHLEQNYLNRNYPHIFLGEKVFSKDGTYDTRNPNNPSEIIGQFQRFDSSMNIDALVTGTKNASERWNDYGIEKRAAVITTFADVLNERRKLITAALVKEVGKSFIEGDAGDAEGIDFCRFNTILARDVIYKRRLLPIQKWAGNSNEIIIYPYGAFLALNPFNFEVAIGVDQIVKPLIMGNAVISSPSDKSSLSGWMIFEAFEEALKRHNIENNGILSYVPGGEAMVDPILRHRDLAGLCFTGSSDVSRKLKKRYGDIERSSGAQLVFASQETSGVDALYIHKDADLRLAAKATAASFCGLSGQKCSALSNLIVHQEVYDKFLGYLKEEVNALSYGATEKGHYLGAVINEQIREKNFNVLQGNLIYRPYKFISQDEYSFEFFVDSTRELKESFPGNKIYQLRQTLTLSENYAKQFVKEMKYRNRELPEIPGRSYHRTIFENSITPYFDMIELMEFSPDFELNRKEAANESLPT